MACLNKPPCQKIKYQPRITDVSAALNMPGVHDDATLRRCRAAGEKTAAEDQAKADLASQCSALNEETKCDPDCDCIGEGAFQAWADVPGQPQDRAWTKTETTPAGCKYKVTIKYRLQYQKTTPGECYKKPPPSPE